MRAWEVRAEIGMVVTSRESHEYTSKLPCASGEIDEYAVLDQVVRHVREMG